MAKVLPTAIINNLLSQVSVTDQLHPQTLGSGGSDGTKYLRDDGVWTALAIVPSAGPGQPQQLSYLYGGL